MSANNKSTRYAASFQLLNTRFSYNSLFSGVSLMIYPYFVNSPILLVVIGCVLLGLPYFIRY